MRKLFIGLMVLALILPWCAVSETIDLNFWTYPIGDFANEQVVQSFVQSFQKIHPGIHIHVEFLDYATGDAKVESALARGDFPDIIFEGPERLVASWAKTGRMLDLSDLWDAGVTGDVIAASPAVEAACRGSDGAYYEYPLCMTTHCMVINYLDFEAADALQYIDEDMRTWTTDDFLLALQALKDHGFTPGMVYCGGQGGDQGTRALITNLFSGSFTDRMHTQYTIDSPENLEALELIQDLVEQGLLMAAPDQVAADEIAMFCAGEISMGFCWNASAAVSNQERLADNVRVFPIAFPSDDGFPELQGGIWGFGIFDHADEARAQAAKAFVKFLCDDPVQSIQSVYATGFFPARASMGDIYAGTKKAENAEYAIFTPYLGDYYQVTPNWANQRTAWWQLLQKVVSGEDVLGAVHVYTESVHDTH